MMFDTLIRGGEVVYDGSRAAVNIAIKGGRIGALLSRDEELQAEKIIDVEGKTVIPGVIDAHFHFNMVGEAMADSFESAACSAAHGGVTTIVPFALGDPALGLPGFLEKMRQEGEATAVLDFALHCRIPHADVRFVDQIPDVVKMGITSIKVFLAYRKEGVMLDGYHLAAVADAVAREGALLMVHCEDGMIIDYLEDKFIKEGRYLPTTLLDSRPNVLESGTIARLASVIGITGGRAHVVHLSARQGLEEIIRAKNKGLQITTETCPQYLLLNASIMERLGGLAKIGPPLREEADQEAMWTGLQTGAIDMIASDHAPNSTRYKGLPPNQFAEVPYGMASTETMLPLIYSEGVLKGRISLERMVEAMCANPAKIQGLYPSKGTLKVGSDADLVVLDPEAHSEIKAKNLHTRSDYTAYEGWKLKGKVVMTMVRGQVMLQEGTLQQSPAYGRFLPRSIPRSS